MSTTALPPELTALLGPFLARQRWFAGSPEAAVEARVETIELLRPGPPVLARVLATAGGATYQVLVGIRPAEEVAALLSGQEGPILGALPGGLMAYDALADPELARVVLELVTGRAEPTERVRTVGVEQSNSSLVYDDRIILKVFRRLQPGPNPEVEVTLALDQVGFNHIAAPVGHWRDGDLDLAIAQEFLRGGTEGWAMALTSLRDLYAWGAEASAPSTGPPVPEPGEPTASPVEEAPPVAGPEVVAAAGGDFGAEARRLGEMTGKLHLALERAFGEEPGDPEAWAAGVTAQVDATWAVVQAVAAGEEAVADLSAGLPPRELVDEVVAGLRAVSGPGLSIRVHGDYHLGQVMRTDQGWFVLDFEGEPARPLAERRRRSSPLRDVAGMLRSLDYATAVALRERGDHERVDPARLDRAWEQRNRASFLQGYLSTHGLGGLLPGRVEDLEVVLWALEVEKAAYELGYELAYRPSWADIPTNALHRLLVGRTSP